MPRPKIARWVGCNPGASFYKPRGVPLRALEQVTLTLGEFEAMRLSDYEGLYQEDAAKEMNVSRQTFGRVLQGAHRKIAEALLFGKALIIEGGDFVMVERNFQCIACGFFWEVPHGLSRPSQCPQCGSTEIRRAIEEPRFMRGRRGWRHGRGGPHTG